MESEIKYLTDEKGKRTAVQIPYEDWKYMTKENKKLKQLLTNKSNSQREIEEPKGKTLAERRRANRGMAKGLIVMADNFNDPLEDFEEYT